MDQATRAFHERDEYHKDPKLYDSLYAEYTKQVERFQHQLMVITKILSTQKTDTEMYKYPSSPSLVLHLGELDDKPKEYFEKTKKEVSRKNSLAKRVHQHKIQNVNTSDDEREVEQEYQKFKKKQNRVSSICDKKIQEFEEQDYLSLKGSKSVSDPIKEEEIKVQYVKPIGGNTLPPEYSKEISRYQPSEKERIRAMKDALSAVRQFMSEGNLGRNGNLNTTTMKEMWDYESREPFSGKIRDFSEQTPEKPRGSQAKSSDECELCGGNHKVEQCPHERKFSLGTDTTSSDSKEKLLNGKSKSVDYPKTQRRRPTIWRPAQSVNGITNLVKYHHTRGTLTLESLLELDPKEDQLGVEHKQILLDSKTKAWVDEQNRMSKEKTLSHDRSRKETKDTKHPDPRINIEPSTKHLKRGTIIASEKDTPQPTRALQEFVKHIADPLVNKGWNLHLKFGKGESQGEKFVKGSSPRESTAKTDKKGKVSKPQIGRQIPLEMGTGGGGGGGKKGGNGSKRPTEDKIDIGDHPSEGDEDDSGSETSLELDLNPQQLASVGLDKPLLKLRLTPRRRRIIATAPQGEMAMMMEMVVEMIHHHLLIMDSQDTIEVKEIDGCMLFKGPPGPPGQPGQDGRDGHGGHAPQLPRGMINVPGVAPAPLDTTGLENSFENLGRTMVDVLAMQQQTNLTLQDQIRRANDAQTDQTLAMHDLADITEQRTYDSMFTAVPIYHGKDDEDFDEWADQLEALCEISHRNIHHEMMGRSSAAVKKIIRSIDPNLRWSLA